MNRNQEQTAWDAFRYVSGEMPPDEQAAFEAKLADDQSAREAIAQAIELTQAVKASYAFVGAQPRRRRLSASALGWMAAGAAACLVMIFVWQLLPRTGAGVAKAPAPASTGTAELSPSAAAAQRSLAARWSQMRSYETETGSASGDVWTADADDSWNVDFESALPAEIEIVEEDRTVAPAWMLAGVSVLRMKEDMMNQDRERMIDPPQEQ